MSMERGTAGEVPSSTPPYDSEVDAAHSSDDGEHPFGADETTVSRVSSPREARQRSSHMPTFPKPDQMMDDDQPHSSPEIPLVELRQTQPRDREYLPDSDMGLPSAPPHYAPISNLRSTAGLGSESKPQADLSAGGHETAQNRDLGGIAAAVGRINKAVATSSTTSQPMEDVKMLEPSDRTNEEHDGSSQTELAQHVDPKHSHTRKQKHNDRIQGTHAESGSPMITQPGAQRPTSHSAGAGLIAHYPSQDCGKIQEALSNGGPSLVKPSAPEPQPTAVGTQSVPSAQRKQDALVHVTALQNQQLQVLDHTNRQRPFCGTDPARQSRPPMQVVRGPSNLQLDQKYGDGLGAAFQRSGAGSATYSSMRTQLQNPRWRTDASAKPAFSSGSVNPQGATRQILATLDPATQSSLSKTREMHHDRFRTAEMPRTSMQHHPMQLPIIQLDPVQLPPIQLPETRAAQSQRLYKQHTPDQALQQPHLSISTNFDSAQPTPGMLRREPHWASKGSQNVHQDPEVQQSRGKKRTRDSYNGERATVTKRRSSYPGFQQVSLSAFDPPIQVQPTNPLHTRRSAALFQHTDVNDPVQWRRLEEQSSIPYQQDLGTIATDFGPLPEPRHVYELRRRFDAGELHHHEKMILSHHALMEFGLWQMERALRQIRAAGLPEAGAPGQSTAFSTVWTLPVSDTPIPHYLPPGRSKEDSLICWAHHRSNWLGAYLASWREKYVDRQILLGRVDRREGWILKQQFQQDFYRESGWLASDPPRGPHHYLGDMRPH